MDCLLHLKSLTTLQRRRSRHHIHRRAPIHPIPDLQRNRSAARVLLRQRTVTELHNRFHHRRHLPPPPILCPQRLALYLPHPISTTTTYNISDRNSKRGSRTRHTRKRLHTPNHRTDRLTATKPPTRLVASERPTPRGAQSHRPRRHRSRHGVQYRNHRHRDAYHRRRRAASAVLGAVVPEHAVAERVDGDGWTCLYEYVDVLLA